MIRRKMIRRSWFDFHWHLEMGLLPATKNCESRMRRECRERFLRHRLQRKPPVSDPDMHRDTCVTHVPWYMSGSLTLAFPAHAQPAILRTWYEAHEGSSYSRSEVASRLLELWSMPWSVQWPLDTCTYLQQEAVLQQAGLAHGQKPYNMYGLPESGPPSDFGNWTGRDQLWIWHSYDGNTKQVHATNCACSDGVWK